MSNKNPSCKFQKGDKPYLLRKTHGRPKTLPIPFLQADHTFRHLFRTYIREKPCEWFDQDLSGDSAFIRVIKKAGHDLTADSTTLIDVIRVFQYLEPVQKSELEGNANESIPAEQKELVEKISKLSLDGLRKIAEILEENEEAEVRSLR